MAALADAHLHLFSPGFNERYDAGWAAADELARYEAFRTAHGIERGLVVGMELGDRFKGNNDHLAGLAADHDWMTPVAFVPVGPPPDLSGLWGRGFAGISLFVLEPGDAGRLAAWPDAALTALNEHRAVVSINALPEAMPGIGRFVDALDGCTVLFSHLGLPGPHALPPTAVEVADRLDLLLALAGRPHTGVKLSALYAATDPPHAWPHEPARPFVSVLLERFGPDRLYWGSDASPALEHVSFAQAVDVLRGMAVTGPETDAIMGGNLIRVLDGRA